MSADDYGTLYSISLDRELRPATAVELYQSIVSGWDGLPSVTHGRLTVRGGHHQDAIWSLADMAGRGWRLVSQPGGRWGVARRRVRVFGGMDAGWTVYVESDGALHQRGPVYDPGELDRAMHAAERL